MTKTINTLSLIFDRLTAVCVLLFLAGMPTLARAQYYYTEYYYADDYDYAEYYSYESNVQDAFAAQNPTASSPSQINGRHNAPDWGGDGYGEDENLHPSDPLPIGDHTILFVLAAITAMVIYLQQRKRKALNTIGAKTLFVLFGLFLASNSLFAQSNGDLRVLYVEQKLEQYEDPNTHQKKTRIVRLYEFASEIIPKRATDYETTISMHIFNMIKDGKDHVNHPELILQEYNGSDWVDIEAHMVFGPLKDKADMGLLPGRKNASPGSDVDDFLYDDGIEKIKKDQTYEDKGYRASGVWNFVIVQKHGQKATFDMDQVERYKGKYYVRVNGDTDYKNDADLVTLSEYAYEHIYEDPIGTLKSHNYTHYACKNLDADANVMFTIATEHSPRIAKELMVNSKRYNDDPQTTDIYVRNQSGGQPYLPAAASVRFSWDIMTNRLTRAYVGDTKTPEGEYLVAHGEGQTPEARHHFQDNTNWMYSVDLGSRKGTDVIVRAKFNDQNQLFWGYSVSEGSPLIADDGSGDDRIYPVRIIYDLKDHRLVTIYRPEAETAGEVNLNTPVMIHRVHNDPATQFLFPSNEETHKAVANGDETEDKYTNPAYAVLTFLEDMFATDAATSHYEKMFYWVSFPFDVKIDDVFGLGAYENYWAVQYYNGAKRALEGLPTEESTGWEYVEKGATLNANQGYVVCLNYRRLCKDYGYKAGGGRKVSLYFPSADRVNVADVHNQDDRTVTLKEYDKGEKIPWNHWNWHLIGIPSFANPGFEQLSQTEAPFFYLYDHSCDGYAPASSSDMTFRAMHAYIFQYAGDIKWTGIVNITPRSIAAQHAKDNPITLRLELIHGDRTQDKTFVQLRSDKGTEGFDLNLDLTKMLNKGANIYSVVNGDQMAGNAIPKEESIIPLGVVIAEAGDYTFAMPEGTSGTQVELIDYETGISTPLAAMDYTVNMPAGSFDNRFALSIKPDKVTTGVDNLGDEATGVKAKKYLIDGALYLVKDGVMYDAQGKLVR